MQSLCADQPSERSPQMSESFTGVERNAKKPECAAADALAELHYLLNDYAPEWYTERHNQRTEEALKILGRL